MANVNSTTMNRAVQISFWNTDFTFFRYIPRSEIAGSYDSYIFNFWQISTFSHNGCSNLWSQQQCTRVPLLCNHTNKTCYCLSLIIALLRGMGISLVLIWFVWWLVLLSILSTLPYRPIILIFFGKTSTQNLCPFLFKYFGLICRVFFFLSKFLIYFGCQSLIRYNLQILFPFCNLPFLFIDYFPWCAECFYFV